MYWPDLHVPARMVFDLLKYRSFQLPSGVVRHKAAEIVSGEGLRFKRSPIPSHRFRTETAPAMNSPAAAGRSWRKDFGETLSREEARSELSRLLHFLYGLAEVFSRE
jgi:hypothetical protein